MEKMVCLPDANSAAYRMFSVASLFCVASIVDFQNAQCKHHLPNTVQRRL